jgi:hypothetical protein
VWCAINTIALEANGPTNRHHSYNAMICHVLPLQPRENPPSIVLGMRSAKHAYAKTRLLAERSSGATGVGPFKRVYGE